MNLLFLVGLFLTVVTEPSLPSMLEVEGVEDIMAKV